MRLAAIPGDSLRGHLPDSLTLKIFCNMYELFLALFLAFTCPAQNNKHCHKDGTTVTTQDDFAPGGDTGGDGGHVPPDGH